MIIRRSLLAAAIAAPTVTACATSAPGELRELPHDSYTHARPNEARVTHVSLNLSADFARKVFTGSATLTIVARADAHEIVLDIDRLNIRAVRTGRGPLNYSIGEHRPNLGAPLTIPAAPRHALDHHRIRNLA